MTTARHRYIDPLAKPKPSKVKLVSTWNDRERRTVRTLMATIALFAVIVAVGGVYLIDVGSKTQKVLKQGHTDRINFQNSIQAQANQNKKDLQALACYAANAVPRGKSPFLDGLAKKYNCPPYRKPVVAPKTSVNPRSTQNSSSNTSTEPSSSPSASPIARRGARQTSSSSPLATTDSPSSTSTPTPTKSSLLGPVCKLLHLNC